jgi:ubiquinone biosynthesis protein
MAQHKQAASIKKVLVGTDRSESADRAARWAAQMADQYQADLFIVQVILSPNDGSQPNGPMEVKCAEALQQLNNFAYELAGPRGHAQVVVHQDPTEAILDMVDNEGVDVVVVGSAGMTGRKQFLLGNVPNRISHNARCTVVIVKTLDPDISQPPVRGRKIGNGAGPGSPGWDGKLLGRGLRIARVLTRAGLRDLLQGPKEGNEAGAREKAQRFRKALDELGPTFAKLGQILSTRPDILPPTFVEELAKLQERVTPLTEAEVVAVMEQELKVPWEDVFASIEPRPLAAGTIAQVHKAVLETGERVVVKVQRPTAEHDIMLDLGLLELFAKKTSDRPAFSRVVDMPAIIRHLSTSLRRELDFRQEAGNIQRMREVLQPFPRLAVPKVYPDFSTSRLLTMEEVQGIPVREAPPSKARTEAAKQLLESFYHQVFVEGFFHADPHPGNMKWWNDKIYFLDLGMVGELEPEVRELLLMLLLSFSQNDVQFLSEVVMSLAGSKTAATDDNLAAFKTDLDHFVQRHRGRTLKEIELGPMLQEIAQICIRHNIRVPASLALVGKAFAQMQQAATQLDPSLDPFSIAGSFFLKSTVKQVAGTLDPRKLFYEVQKARLRFLRLMEAIEGATGARPGKRFQVDFKGTERLEQTISMSSQWLSLALVVTGTVVGTAVTAASSRVPWGVPAGIASAGLVLSLALIASIYRRSN